MSMIEALCTRCNEIFVPHGIDDEDLIHGETYMGVSCGGIGVIQGEWVASDNDARRMTEEFGELKNLLPIEKHGLEMPHCDDPDCEFHHPEVRES